MFRGALKNCKNVGFVNIGRGNVIEEDDIIEALNHGWLKGAVLDVFHTEPLPKDSKLWSHPNIIGTFSISYKIHENILLKVSPHVAGVSRAQDIAQCFAKNIENIAKGKELNCLVDWNTLY